MSFSRSDAGFCRLAIKGGSSTTVSKRADTLAHRIDDLDEGNRAQCGHQKGPVFPTCRHSDLPEGEADTVIARSGSLVPQYEFPQPPSLQSSVNAAFAPAMAGTAADGEYVSLRIGGQKSKVNRPSSHYRSRGRTTIAGILSNPVSTHLCLKPQAPLLTGNESSWTVEENKQLVRIAPRHICILFRPFRNFSADVTRPYVRALEARRLPHVLVGATRLLLSPRHGSKAMYSEPPAGLGGLRFLLQFFPATPVFALQCFDMT